MIWESLFPPLRIPAADLPSFYFAHAKATTVYGREPGRVAITDKGQTLTFAEIESCTEAFASGLHNRLGFGRGDVLAMVLPNSMYYPIAVMGTHMVGGVVTTANPAYGAQELAHQFGETKPRVIVTRLGAVPTVKEALAICGLSVPDSSIITADGGAGDIRGFFSSQPFPRVTLRTERDAATTPAFIVFSSGTSGKPKGVVLSHRSMVANALQFLAMESADGAMVSAMHGLEPRRWLHVLPMFHIYGILVSGGCILSGSTMVVMEAFDFEAFCGLIQEYRIDTVYVAPPVILAMVKSPIAKKYDLSSLKALCSGAAPLTKELQVEAAQKLGLFVVQGYGMTETSPIVTRSLASDNVPGSAGRLCPNTEAVFIDSDGRQVGAGQTGELCVRGPQVMLRYLNNKEATDEALDADGFLHTGDIGHITPDGLIYITDRKKELIKYKGFQVAPAELEGLLTDHPDVSDAAVIPVYSKAQATELPKAFVVLCPGTRRPGIEADIAEWIAARVIHYKKLRGGVELIDTIPKSATGKILRKVLKELEAARAKGAKL